MAWIEGAHHTHKDRISSMETLYDNVKGKLSDDEARIWFVKFCQSNLYFTVRLLTGIKLHPIQEIKLRTFFLRNFILDIEGRGSGKTFIVSLFVILYALFNPGVKIGICSGTFRQSKLIFRQIEKFMKSDEGMLLRQCLNGKPMHSADMYEMQLGQSIITAVPLTEKIRGLRFNVIVLDELLLVPTDIIDKVIIPFLSANLNGMENKELYEAESRLIIAGRLTEAERSLMPSNKVIGLSSASYKFEPLYKEYYEPYLAKIQDVNETGVNHALIRLSYEAAPEGLMNMEIIEEARSRTSRSTFDREYKAIFTDDGSGYFKPKDIMAASLGGDDPNCIRLKGLPNKKYILAIDPNYSQSETADDFAMCVIEIDDDHERGIVVHSYALPNSKINKRSIYLKYLLENFNIVYVIADNAGGPSFISDAEQFLGEFPSGFKMLKFEDTFLEEDGVRLARKEYSPATGKIVHYQLFNQRNWLRLANETLQYHIESKKILFGAPLFSEEARKSALSQDIPIGDLEFSPQYDKVSGKEKMQEFIDHQNYLLDLTKKELTLIEVTTNVSGHQTFDIPKHLQISSDPKRARKDSYTVLLLASWALKCYFDMFKMPEKPKSSFRPTWVA